jgi:hypothetical protein
VTTIGTHNLADGKAPATPFADVIFFTEAHPINTLPGYEMFKCPKQRDLVIAVSEDLGWDDLRWHYDKALFGARRVSPHRGTLWLTGDRAMVALVVEHRINAAFPPYRRGEALFRRLAWWSHSRMTLRIIRRLVRKGYTVHAGGDLNTPRGVSGYDGVLNERGTHYDRLGSTRPMGPAKTLSRLGSDHWRIKARVR